LASKKLTSILISLAVFGLCFLFNASALSSSPFSSRGEGREARVVTDMVEHGYYIVPKRNESDLSSKPPLFHWTAALASHAAGGHSPFSIRLPSAIAASLASLFLFWFVSALRGRRAGILSVLILATTVEWATNAGHARVDMCFSLFVFLGAASLFQALQRWRQVGSVDERWLLAAGIFNAFAVLAKGPAGILFPWTTAGIYLLLILQKPRLRSFMRLPFEPLITCLVLSLVLSGAWYIAAAISEGGSFI